MKRKSIDHAYAEQAWQVPEPDTAGARQPRIRGFRPSRRRFRVFLRSDSRTRGRIAEARKSLRWLVAPRATMLGPLQKTHQVMEAGRLPAPTSPSLFAKTLGTVGASPGDIGVAEARLPRHRCRRSGPLRSNRRLRSAGPGSSDVIRAYRIASRERPTN